MYADDDKDCRFKAQRHVHARHHDYHDHTIDHSLSRSTVAHTYLQYSSDTWCMPVVIRRSSVGPVTVLTQKLKR